MKGIEEIYDAYYASLSRAKKAELTRFVNYVQWNIPRHTKAKAIAIFIHPQREIYDAKELKK